jgi:hypothetical protein
MRKYTLEEIQKFAVEKGGKCLSEEYVDSTKKMLWECSKGHRWETSASSIINHSSWCRKCCNKRPTKYRLEDAKNIANQKGGKCLSTELNNSTDKLLWECDKGHKWIVTFQDVLRGSWCAKCAQDSQRLPYDELNKVASLNNGVCLSQEQEYVNAKTKLLWRCEEGHVWKATYGNIKTNGSWCPYCSGSYAEKKFRNVLEDIFNKSFKKIRPKWLINKKGNRLELDGFNEELSIAFEYQGRQHFEYIKHWNKRTNKFKQTVEHDKIKRKVLKEKNIILLAPTHKLKLSQLKDFALQELKENGVNTNLN